MSIIQKDITQSVVYQIYIKSFCDSDGDGIGDLPGITSKLDYLAQLGIDYMWITPFYPSPQRDNGYDVSDYCAIDPVYGTMGDFDELVRQAHARDIGVMLDMVLCHTSDKHEWFQRACAGEERYRRYYILRDGRGSTGPGDPGEPPTNWQCAFGGSAWEWEPRLGKWYLHMHDASQPDLDWTDPDVREACADVVRFWRDHGVDGFRFDVVSLISKPEVFEDVPGGACRGVVADGPHVHEYLRELVERAGISGMLTVGEMASTTLESCVHYTNPVNHELTMTFNFHHLKVDYANGDKWELAEPDIDKLRDIFRTWQEGMQAGGGWNALFWNNHDQPRAITRFSGRAGVGEHGGSWEHVGRTLAICTHLMQGTPYIFQGEELGMTNPGYASIEDFDDVESLNNYRLLLDEGKTPDDALHIVNERSRDCGRTPMQWTSDLHAGFTSGAPWLKVPENHTLINAEAEVGEPDSMFAFYQELVRIRHELDVVARGRVRVLDAGADAPKVIAYERTIGGARLVVACSFDDAPCRVSGLGLDEGYDLLIGSHGDEPQHTDGGGLALRPHESAVYLRR